MVKANSIDDTRPRYSSEMTHGNSNKELAMSMEAPNVR
eukprot:CAMPEP_0168752288 /NCGR_PEP_ID=MMETSP0724-20121128/18305_1 /TAXON_ID=265536 /ORGANISM="Amphiprora sp., Strain CCMP467" /LENGTH=37 /DNA_ID= /DNA_START= /DNA_END= /DNA_ORIENTATION=